MNHFRVAEYCRRELAALRRRRAVCCQRTSCAGHVADDDSVTTEQAVRDLVTVPEGYQRWLRAEGAKDPVFARMVAKSLAYREAMLALMENPNV